MSCNYWGPCALKTALHNKRNRRNEKPMYHNKKVSPGSWQLEKSLCGNEDAIQPKIKFKKKFTNFHGRNTPIMAVCKLLIWLHWTWNWEEICTNIMNWYELASAHYQAVTNISRWTQSLLDCFSLSLSLFFLLYNIILVLPYIDMNLPQVYTCSPPWTPFPPPSLLVCLSTCIWKSSRSGEQKASIQPSK